MVKKQEMVHRFNALNIPENEGNSKQLTQLNTAYAQ
jgi:hypothetical protein